MSKFDSILKAVKIGSGVAKVFVPDRRRRDGNYMKFQPTPEDFFGFIFGVIGLLALCGLAMMYGG